jgi:hypothetical protein
MRLSVCDAPWKRLPSELLTWSDARSSIRADRSRDRCPVTSAVPLESRAIVIGNSRRLADAMSVAQ